MVATTQKSEHGGVLAGGRARRGGGRGRGAASVRRAGNGGKGEGDGGGSGGGAAGNRRPHRKGDEDGVGELEKWLGLYSSTQSILLVGEGDFSFSLALATAFGSGANLVSTSLDTKGLPPPIAFRFLLCPVKVPDVMFRVDRCDAFSSLEIKATVPFILCLMCPWR